LVFAGWLIGWAFSAAWSAEPPAASKDWTAVLTPLEAAVAADPESLKNESEYRMAVIQAAAYERALDFYQKLVADHPQSAQAALNYGYAYVDKIPASGSITQVILANTALGWFTKSVELQRTWLALYTRGNSYLYWPKVFGRAPLGVADLEAAVKLAKTLPKRAVYARAYVALGEGYWKIDEIDKARAAWTEGEKLFPDNPQLKALLARQGDDLKAYIEDEIDPNKRVDTNLRPLWENP
jgi:tetratricopeptide (TPR) repeat protein